MMNSTLNPVSNIDQVVELVQTLYNSNNPAEQAEANRRLTELQSTNEAWEICWHLLDTNKHLSLETRFYAANTLLLKINQSWAQQDAAWLENVLRPKLCDTIVQYASSPDGGQLVVERLALALASFALHSMPTFWPDAIENILQTFTPQNLPDAISPERICDILLKILLYIPEEYAVLMPQQDHRAKLNYQMTKTGPTVFRFLYSVLIEGSPNDNQERKKDVLKCLTSWTLHSKTSLLELEDGYKLVNQLYSLIFSDVLCDMACSTLAATFSSQKAENYKNAIIDFIPKISNLTNVIRLYKMTDEMENAIKVYSLIINFSENHSRLFLKIILDEEFDMLQSDISGKLKGEIFNIISTILDCTSAPGTYLIDEKYSDLSFTFWFIFFENFCYYTTAFTDKICKALDGLVMPLLNALIRKAQFPPTSIYQDVWNDDQREQFRCYRQDLGDNISLIIQFPRARDPILVSLQSSLARELQQLLQAEPTTGEKPWQTFEAYVFALKSIAEAIPYDESICVTKIFETLAQVPFYDRHPLLYCTVAEMISAYSDWLYTHNTHLAVAFNILFLGINSTDSHVRLISTISLKDVTSECQIVLQPYAPQILSTSTAAILQPVTQLSTNEKSRIMYTIGTTLAICDSQLVTSTVNTLTTPIINELAAKAQADPIVDPTARPVILDRLTMMNSLIESLYVKPTYGNSYENEGDENDPQILDLARFDQLGINDTTQPSLSILEKLVPLLAIIASRHQKDEDIMVIISNTIKRSCKSLNAEIKPLVKDILIVLVNAYDPLVTSNLLEGSQGLYSLFKTDETVSPYLADAFIRISDKTLEVCVQNPLRQLSVTIENYFRYATFVCKKIQGILNDQAFLVKPEYIYKLAVTSLELPEKRTLAEVCNFLVQFKQRSYEFPQLEQIFINQLDVMVCNIFNILGGNYSTPRNALDHAYDLLYCVMDCSKSKDALKLIIERENFPTIHVNTDQKAKFVSRLLHEKNRRKFKDICSEFVLLVRNLNRLV